MFFTKVGQKNGGTDIKSSNFYEQSVKKWGGYPSICSECKKRNKYLPLKRGEGVGRKNFVAY